MNKISLILFLIFSSFSVFGNNESLINEEAPPVVADITFCVDLSCLPAVTAPSVAGTFNGWNFGANPLADQGGGIWCTTGKYA